MIVEVDIKAASAVLRLRKGPKKLVYTMVNAINDTAKDVQKAVQGRIKNVFTVRKPEFIASQVKVFGAKFDAAGQSSRWQARVFMAAETQRLLLPKFEEGGERKPFTPGAKHIAAPFPGGPARPTPESTIPQAFTFQGLQFKQIVGGRKVRRRRRGRTVDESIFGEFGRLRKDLGKGQWRGQQRTYLIPGKGVFQRTGKGKGATRLVWGFLKPFRLDRRLGFYFTATKALRGSFEANVKRWVDDAFAHEAARSSR